MHNTCDVILPAIDTENDVPCYLLNRDDDVLQLSLNSGHHNETITSNNTGQSLDSQPVNLVFFFHFRVTFLFIYLPTIKLIEIDGEAVSIFFFPLSSLSSEVK